MMIKLNRCFKIRFSSSTNDDQFENFIDKLSNKDFFNIKEETPTLLDVSTGFSQEEIQEEVLRAIEETVSKFNLNVIIENYEELGVNSKENSIQIIVWRKQDNPEMQCKIEVKFLIQFEKGVDSPRWNGPKMSPKMMDLYNTCIIATIKSEPKSWVVKSWMRQTAKCGFKLDCEDKDSNKQEIRKRISFNSSQVKNLLYISLYSEESPSKVLLTTKGQSADWRGGRLGIYEKAGTYNNCPYYVQLHNSREGEPYVFFKHNFGCWCVGDTLGCSNFYLKTDSDTCSKKWMYEKISERRKRKNDFVKEEWIHDPELKLKRAIPLPCGDIQISSTGDVETVQPECLGLYKPTNLFSRGRMVFKHVSNERYLMVDHWKVFWCIKDNADSRWAPRIHSNCAPSHCPADQRAKISFKTGRTQWRYNKGLLYCPTDLTIICAVHGK